MPKNTKEAIEFFESWIKNTDSEWIIRVYGELLEVVRRGEKFEKMWKKLSKTYGNYFSTFDVRIANDVEYKYLDELMNVIKKKYFKEV